MTLLREVMEPPLAPAYALAAERRTAGATPSRRGIVLTLILALVCGAVTARAIAELRRPQPGAAQAQAALQQEIRRRGAAVDADQSRLDQLRAQVTQLQRQAVAGGGGGGPPPPAPPRPAPSPRRPPSAGGGRGRAGRGTPSPGGPSCSGCSPPRCPSPARA